MTTSHRMRAAIKGTIKQGQADGLIGSDEELEELKKKMNVTVSKSSGPIRLRRETIGTPYTLQMLGYLHLKYSQKESVYHYGSGR